jgi:alpha-L-fucosidase 2
MTNGGGSYPNLFDAHPPFQIDGNFGATDGIAEMLVQGDSKSFQLLPAAPQSWLSAGSVKGIRLKGDVSVDFTWKDGKITSKTVRKARS